LSAQASGVTAFAGPLGVPCPQEEATTFERITTDPDVMGGVPCIRGLRVPVAMVVGLVADGMTTAEILEEYPYLESATVDAEIYLVEVASDGVTVDMYVDVCEQEAELVEFEETDSEVRAQVIRTVGRDMDACAISFRRDLIAPLNGRPFVDLSTGEPISRVTDLSS